MFATFLVAVALLATSAVCVAFKSFSEGCMPIDGQFFGEDRVGFYCMVEDSDLFDYKYSTIELGHCLANHNGDIIGYEDGSYHESCDDCTLDSARHGPDDEDRVCYIKCKCHNMDGDRVETKFNLNDVLKNDNGRLTCFDHRGTRDTKPPECHHNVACSTGSRRLTPRAEATPFVTPKVAAI